MKASTADALRVLVVEDHQDTADTICRTMRALGHEVLCARCIAEARQILSSERLDAMVLDILLPDGFGWELLENPKLPKGIYVGVLTAWSGGDYRQRMSDLGCRDFLFKPFGVELLPSFLQRAMHERRRNGTK